MSDAPLVSVAALQAAAQEATPGPWECNEGFYDVCAVGGDHWVSAPGDGDSEAADARFIALADPQAVAALCAIAQAAHVVCAPSEAYTTSPDCRCGCIDALRAALGAVSFTDTTTDNGAET